ncbi:hypothetical protein RJ640_023737 [Escallonia rubra]|uniref:non-specific serine/threonine protein kinase n=1 Tax=Escallonia rubra TaxID=112253 RepID=A0AA88R381_9ASTE|nr:hypothetical protein RJ640_023737 [Escallonia rubra]
MGLTGTIPKEVGNFTSLVFLNISNNSLQGHLPAEVGLLHQLQYMNLQFNELSGEIPSSLSRCWKLRQLSLNGNKFNGSIPGAIGNLSKLEELYLGENDLQGELPETFFNISSLVEFDIPDNEIAGSLPADLCYLLPMLEHIGVGVNKFTGEIPSSLPRCASLQSISLAGNNFTGIIPKDIGNLSVLQTLYIGGNQLTGTIPNSISNSSKISFLDLGNNMLTGNVPTFFGELTLLQSLQLGPNLLTIEPFLGLSFLTSLTNCRSLSALMMGSNRLHGVLPNSVGNLSASLQFLDATGCHITGMIPSEIGNLSNLLSLYLGDNDLTGSIPETIGKLQKIQRLQVYDNAVHGLIPDSICKLTHLGELILMNTKLHGSIPSCLGNLTSLQKLQLGSNALTSHMPSTLGSLKDILYLDLSSNLLIGPLPHEIGSMKSIVELQLSGNQFSGYIPTSIGQLQNLFNLSLSRNRLQGPIPKSFADLVSLEFLDLSLNSLSGTIPRSLEKLWYLGYLNVSFNELSGEIPNGGTFDNFTAGSFIGNEELCGAPQFHVKACKGNKRIGFSKNKIFQVYILPSIMLIIIVAAFTIWLLRRRASNTHLLVQENSLLYPFNKRISYYEILQATNNFSEDNLIGRGSIGLVYKGIFYNGMVAAVKVFNLQLQAAFKSFEAECEAMRNIRHRNLVKVISSCSNPDFRALVLEYMPNGNLENWLYTQDCFLDIDQRIGIMIDVAAALEYLHDGCSSPVVHCDLKPSNILLDEDMVARVSDFGIAKLLTEDRPMTQTKTLGTIGYMAPGTLCLMIFLQQLVRYMLSSKYGTAGIVTPMGDVYSYGILLMETFTRKKPTDDLFVGELTMKKWVSDSFSQAVLSIVDANLLAREEEEFSENESCMSMIMEIALNCTEDSPDERINMRDVVDTRRYLNFFKLAPLFLLISLLPTSQLKPGAMKKTAVVMMFVILLLLHYCLDACLAASVTNFTDEPALLAFKASIISDPNNILAKNWSQGISFCSWIGVSCSSDKRVTALNLPNMGLTGTIPEEVGSLTYLTSFNISNNTFNGTLPRELGLLQRLQSINLRANKLSGSIPAEIGNLTKLEELDFGVNDFTGEIPASIFNISSLQRLSLRNNSLVGTLPADMCNNLYNLGFLSLSFLKLPIQVDSSPGVAYRRISYHEILQATNNLSEDNLIGRGSVEYGSAGIISTMGDVYSYGILLMETFTRKKPTDEQFTEEMSMTRWVSESFPRAVIQVVDANLLGGDEATSKAIVSCLSETLGVAIECTAELPEERINMKEVLVRLTKTRKKLQDL